jgi:polar amino acid transport system substrate-binding protein
MQRKISCFISALAGFAVISNAARAAGGGAVYSAAQASQGEAVYSTQCVSCHGATLEGNIGPALKGSQFQQMAAAQQLTGASLLAVIAASMPKSNPGGLTSAQYAQLTAYILQQNGYPAGTAPLSANDPKLQALRLSKPPPGH